VRVARRREHRGGQREVHPVLGQAGDVLPRDDDLEDLPVDLPVTQLDGSRGIPAQVGDVQASAQVVEHQARFLPVLTDRP
jgi:hypothetical protein